MRIRYAVVGGAGFIGSYLTKHLLDLGYEVTVIDDLTTGKLEYLDKRAEMVLTTDIRTDVAQMEAAFAKCVGVFHLAAIPQAVVRKDPAVGGIVNVHGTINVLEAAQRASRVGRVVFASSAWVYGAQGRLILTEDMEPDPQPPYAVQKHMGEKYCQMCYREWALETLCLRLGSVYGPRVDRDASVIGRFIGQRQRSEPLTIVGDGQQTRDFVYITDVAEALVRAMLSRAVVCKGQAINIGTGWGTTINEVARLIAGPDYPIAPIPKRDEPRHLQLDVTRAGEMLGFETKMSLAAGIARLRQNPEYAFGE